MPNSGYNATQNDELVDSALNLRRLQFSDLPNVEAIEARSFSTAWSSGMFALEMSKPGSLCMVATAIDNPDLVFGYIVFSRYDLAWHLMNIAVSPEYRRLGVATILIEEGLSKLGNSSPVTLEVRPSNEAAIALYQGFEFDSYGCRKGYYPDNGEDALIMWRGNPADAGVPTEGRPVDRHRRPRPARLKPSGV